MARPSNADTLARYRARIRKSRDWRQKDGYDATWTRLVDLYRGRQFENLSVDDRIVVNISFSTINVIAPSVSVNNPKITVNARTPDRAAHAVVTEAVINYWWKHYRFKKEFRRAVNDFLMVGHGWLKCGYRYVSEDLIDDDDDSAVVDGNDITPKTIVHEDRPFVERVSFHDVYVDPDATCVEDLRWIAQRIRRTAAEVRTDERYAPTARNAIGSGSRIDSARNADKSTPNDTGMDYVDIWEFYDVFNGTMAVFAEHGEGFLIKPKEMPYPFGHPFVMIRNYDVPDQFYPIGDLEALEPLQRELNATRTQMMNHRKKYARKYLYRETAFDINGRNQMESDVDNVLVPVIGDENLQNVIMPFPTVVTPPEFYNHSNLIMDDANMVSAVSEYMRGGMPDIRRTATEAAISQDAANSRAADKLAIIEDCIGEVARRVIMLAQKFLTGDQVARVVGADGQPLWVTYDGDYIAGEFDFEVEGGSTAPVNESFRRQMALQMVDALAPFLQLGVINPQALAAHVLQFGFGVKNPQEFMQAAPPPMDPNAPPGAGGPPPGPPGMPPMGGPPMGGPPPSDQQGGPPSSSIDPAVLGQLAAKMGLDLNHLGG